MDYNITFGSEHGRRVLIDLLQYAHVLEAPSLHEVEPNLVIFREGRRDVAARILQLLNVDPSKFLTLLEENRDDD